MQRNARADVCVVGAGIAGLTAAYLLAREGRTVIVLDAGDVGAGQTGATTAHLSNAIDDTYVEIMRVHGPDGGRLACDSHTRAIDCIAAICNAERISCEFQRIDGFLFAGAGHTEQDLDQELEAARACGADVMKMPAAPVEGFRTGPCLRFSAQAQFHPLHYLNGLAAAFQRHGGELFTGTTACKATGGRDARVETTNHCIVSSEAIVVATNSPFVDLLAIHTKQAPYHTYAIGARMAAGAMTHALYWDTEDPYHYVRLQRTTNRALGGDNDDPVDILIVGGEDHKAGHAKDADARFGRLEAWMRDHVPGAGDVEFRWSGQVMETVDGLAFIGRNPLDAANLYIATGDSGMGMTHGTIAGMLLSDLILGRKNPWSELYDPSRVRSGAVVEWVKENVDVAVQFTSWLTRGDVESAEQITPNNGAVLVEAGRKIAAYRDERGVLHKRSAVCPHLGCIVAWNPAASTWDCPCHGSRFDKYGTVVSGPSAQDLEHL